MDIPNLDKECQTEHKIKAFAVERGSGLRSEVLDELQKLQAKHRNEYKAIIKVMKLVASSKRVLNDKHVKPSKNQDGTFEMKVFKGQTRFFFFYYTQDEAEVVVCTNFYWKDRDSVKEQNKHFRKCAELKAFYEQNT